MKLIEETKGLYQLLTDYGFKGSILKDMMILIKDEDDLDELDSFIINNEESCRTILSIASSYRLYKIRREPVRREEFISEYSDGTTVEARRVCLEKLLKCYIDRRWTDSLDEHIHNGWATLIGFYDSFEKQPNLNVKKLLLEARIVNGSI